MFFIKLAFWLGVLVLLLPTDTQQQARLYHTAVATIERASTFCDRNAKTCEVAAEAWATFLKKAEFAARLVGEVIAAQGHPDASDAPRHAPQSPGNGKTSAQGTLLPADMEAAWRGPRARPAGS